MSNVTISIDPHSGFCFGVQNAVSKAVEELAKGAPLYSLGAMVHNPAEVKRLADMGLQVIDHNQFNNITNSKVLFRAHGEPPESYSNIQQRGIELIDATCPVVLRLQQRIKSAYQKAVQKNGQIVIFGKKGHAEVVGLIGQTNGTAILIESELDIDKIDFNRPIEFFSQTTKDVGHFMQLVAIIEKKATDFCWHDTICRQVANRGPLLHDFAAHHDLMIFVGGADSSNAKALFDICKQVNPRSIFVESPTDITANMLKGATSIGISGATSTPSWLIQNVESYVRSLVG